MQVRKKMSFAIKIELKFASRNEVDFGENEYTGASRARVATSVGPGFGQRDQVLDVSRIHAFAIKNNKLTFPRIGTIRDERMAQCFPTYAADYPELMKALKKLVTDGYNERVPVRPALLPSA